MLFYYVLTAVVSGSSFLLKNNKKARYVVPFMILFAVAALRSPSIGVDNGNYSFYLEEFGKRTWGEIALMDDRLFYALMKIVHMLHGNFQVFLAADVFIFLFGVFWFVKEFCDTEWLSLFLFITMAYYQSSFTTLRMAAAMCAALIAVGCAAKKKPKHFIAAVVIAASCHASALAVLLVYPLLKMKYRKEYFVLAGLGLAAAGYFKKQIFGIVWQLFGSHYAYHEENIGKAGGGGTLFVVYIGMLVFILLCTFWLRSHKEVDFIPTGTMICQTLRLSRVYTSKNLANETARGYRMSQLLAVCAVLSVLIQSFTSILPILYRLGNYFSLPMFLLLPNLIRDKFNDRDRRLLQIGIMMIATMFYTRYLYNEIGVTGGSVPYRLMDVNRV